MYEFLNKEYLNNTIGQYFIVAFIILLVFVVKKYVAHYIAGLIFKVLKARWKTIDRDSFKTLVVKPLGLFLVAFVTIAALDKLKFPEELDFKIYHLSINDLLRMIGTSLLIITFFLFIIKCIDFIVMALKERYLTDGDHTNHQLLFFFKDFIKVIVGLLGILLMLKYVFNYPISNLVTGLSIVGAAIALALKESLENLIASFIIFFDKPFATGDIVKGSNFSGTVEKIGLRSTRIRTEDKTYITVPNKQMVDSVVDNLSNRLQRRAVLNIEIEPSTPSQKVTSLLNGIKEILTIKEIENFSANLNDITPSALLINCSYFTAPTDLATFNTIKQTVNMGVLQLLEQLEIEISGSVTDIKIKHEPGTTS